MIHNGVKGNKFQMLNHNVNTRYNDGCKIDLIKPRNEHVRKASFYLGSLRWNELSLDLRELDSKQFKTQINEKIRSKGIPVL